MIELRGVVKRYGGTFGVDHVDLRVGRGERAALIGPSGCGKSTLLRLLMGLLTPDAGEIRVAGEALHRDNALQLRRRLGYVIQEGGLFPHLTAGANAALLDRWLGTDSDAVDARIEELAGLVRLPRECLGRYPAELSGGQRQRVALMRALMRDPEALLLDEPLGALDPMIRAELGDDLLALCGRLSKTVLLVTHDLAEAAHFAERILVMRAGAIVQEGRIEDLAAAPVDAFVERFVRAQRRLHLPS